MDLSDIVKQSIIDTATCMADAARTIALSYFRTESQAIENKLTNGFDPVTIADKEIAVSYTHLTLPTILLV